MDIRFEDVVEAHQPTVFSLAFIKLLNFILNIPERVCISTLVGSTFSNVIFVRFKKNKKKAFKSKKN